MHCFPSFFPNSVASWNTCVMQSCLDVKRDSTLPRWHDAVHWNQMGSFGGALIDVFVYAWICNAVVPSFLSLFHASVAL